MEADLNWQYTPTTSDLSTGAGPAGADSAKVSFGYDGLARPDIVRAYSGGRELHLPHHPRYTRETLFPSWARTS